MALNYVTLILDLYDGSGNPITSGAAALVPSSVLTDVADQVIITQEPVPGVFHASGFPQVTLLATDNAAPRPAGWTWGISFAGMPAPISPFSFFLPYASGATQYLSSMIPVSTGNTFQAYLPLPSGTAAAGKVPVAIGSGTATAWKYAPVDWLNAVTVSGADPAGVADSTSAIQAALNAAANGQPVYLPAGVYKTTSPITLPPGSVLLGPSAWDSTAFADVGATIKPSASFTGTEVLYMTDTGSAPTQGSVIRHLGIDGSALAVTADGIRAFGPVRKAIISDVTISSCTGWGINQVADSGATGNQVPYSWRVSHVLVSSCASGGFNLPAHTDSTWADVETIGSGGTSGHGFAITGAPSNSHFTNCRAEWTGTGDGFHLTGSWNTGTGSGPFTMTGCSTDRNQQNGFYCDATGKAPVIVANCMFRRDGRNSKTGGGSYAGIQLNATSIPLFFSNVTVFPGTDDDGTGTNSPQYGVSFASSTFVQILSGYVQGNTAGVNGTISGSQLIAPNVIVASGSTGGPSTNLTDWYRPANAILQTDNAIQVPSSFVSAQRFSVGGITGATAGCRLVGAIASGTAPASGTFNTGDMIIVLTGSIIICTAGGTPGTWAVA